MLRLVYGVAASGCAVLLGLWPAVAGAASPAVARLSHPVSVAEQLNSGTWTVGVAQNATESPVLVQSGSISGSAGSVPAGTYVAALYDGANLGEAEAAADGSFTIQTNQSVPSGAVVSLEWSQNPIYQVNVLPMSPGAGYLISSTAFFPQYWYYTAPGSADPQPVGSTSQYFSDTYYGSQYPVVESSEQYTGNTLSVWIEVPQGYTATLNIYGGSWADHGWGTFTVDAQVVVPSVRFYNGTESAFPIYTMTLGPGLHEIDETQLDEPSPNWTCYTSSGSPTGCYRQTFGYSVYVN